MGLSSSYNPKKTPPCKRQAPHRIGHGGLARRNRVKFWNLADSNRHHNVALPSGNQTWLQGGAPYLAKLVYKYYN